MQLFRKAAAYRTRQDRQAGRQAVKSDLMCKHWLLGGRDYIIISLVECSEDGEKKCDCVRKTKKNRRT
jgi:hypothetical protein